MQRHCRLDRLLWSYSVTLQWLIPTRYQSAIYSRSQPSFFLPSSHSKQRKIRPLTKKNSLSLLSTAHVGLLQSLHDQPSTCPFCAPGGPKSAQSFHRQTFYSGRGLVWPKTRMWDLDLREVGHVSIFNEVTESRWSHVLEVCLDDAWMGLQSWFIAVPVQLLWMAAVSWGFGTQKGHYIPTQKYRNLMANFILNSQALVAEIFALEER